MDHFKNALPDDLGIEKIHHVAVIVRDLEASLGFYRDKLGLRVDSVMDMEYDHVQDRVPPRRRDEDFELVQPIRRHDRLGTLLEAKGEGFHHVCFEVDDIQGRPRRPRGEGSDPDRHRTAQRR